MLCVVLGASASAQVCKESNGNVAGKANMDCDMRYRDQLVTCDKKNPSSTKEVLGTRPACPAKPMPMLDTPKASYIADYNPFLFQYPRDPGDSSKPYAGAFVLGTPGDASRTFQLFGNTAPGTKRLSSCTTQIKLPTDPKNDSEWAMLTRLQADNCANQYILNSAIWPFQKESTKILSLDDPKNPGKKIDLDGECQPLKPASGEKNEYDATVYLKAAWTKLLIDPEYRKTTKALKRAILQYHIIAVFIVFIIRIVITHFELVERRVGRAQVLADFVELGATVGAALEGIQATGESPFNAVIRAKILGGAGRVLGFIIDLA
jgi:hypothetical protein